MRKPVAAFAAMSLPVNIKTNEKQSPNRPRRMAKAAHRPSIKPTRWNPKPAVPRHPLPLRRQALPSLHNTLYSLWFGSIL